MNVVIHRVPRKESVVWPASHCPACGEDIKPLDNIPLLSYAMIRGRCRNCGVRISARYPLVEALTGLLFGAAAYKFGVGLQSVTAIVLHSRTHYAGRHGPRTPAAAERHRGPRRPGGVGALCSLRPGAVVGIPAVGRRYCGRTVRARTFIPRRPGNGGREDGRYVRNFFGALRRARGLLRGFRRRLWPAAF